MFNANVIDIYKNIYIYIYIVGNILLTTIMKYLY